jgi:hypothetical protein
VVLRDSKGQRPLVASLVTFFQKESNRPPRAAANQNLAEMECLRIQPDRDKKVA